MSGPSLVCPACHLGRVSPPCAPAELVERTGTWLREKSGARLTERCYAGLGHRLSEPEFGDIRAFLAGL